MKASNSQHFDNCSAGHLLKISYTHILVLTVYEYTISMSTSEQ